MLGTQLMATIALHQLGALTKPAQLQNSSVPYPTYRSAYG